MKISAEIKNLKPYVPGKPISETKREFGLKSVVKMASNENPLGASPKALAAIKKAAKEINLYPDGACFELKEAYAKEFGLNPNQLVFGNGSDELLNILMQIYCSPGDKIVTFENSFIAYKIAAQAHSLLVNEICLKDNFEYDITGLLDFIHNRWTDQHKLIFIANPNNPTGSYIRNKDFAELVTSVREREDLLLIIDEAYVEFARSQDYAYASRFLSTCPNLLILRTFSKVYGLAGARVGTLIGNKDVIDLVNRVRVPFNVNAFAQFAAVAALKDKTHIKKSQKIVWQGLDYFYEELGHLGLKFWPSEGNFILTDIGQDSGRIYNELLKRGLILRPLKPYGLNTHLRISVGTKTENKLAIKLLREVLGKK